eukprot:TRINITY_DN4689_c0_g1_i3.p2 TRINITY_DN4689_c0_g1~~TRINITY_DN4689_c0_g1_i3.p2  ORF type:complete len:152 (+),score=17.06 TRINITY_DN4689_c0_g1_i3:102-557(+)
MFRIVFCTLLLIPIYGGVIQSYDVGLGLFMQSRASNINLHVHGSTLFISNETHIQLYDISDPMNMERMGAIAYDANNNKIIDESPFISDSLLCYIEEDSSDGFRIDCFDIRDRMNVKVIPFYQSTKTSNPTSYKFKFWNDKFYITIKKICQ